MNSSQDDGITYYSGPPIRPPGWDNPNNPNYPVVPEFSAYGLFMGIFLVGFMLTKRRRKV